MKLYSGKVMALLIAVLMCFAHTAVFAEVSLEDEPLKAINVMEKEVVSEMGKTDTNNGRYVEYISGYALSREMASIITHLISQSYTDLSKYMSSILEVY